MEGKKRGKIHFLKNDEIFACFLALISRGNFLFMPPNSQCEDGPVKMAFLFLHLHYIQKIFQSIE